MCIKKFGHYIGHIVVWKQHPIVVLVPNELEVEPVEHLLIQTRVQVSCMHGPGDAVTGLDLLVRTSQHRSVG